MGVKLGFLPTWQSTRYIKNDGEEGAEENVWT